MYNLPESDKVTKQMTPSRAISVHAGLLCKNVVGNNDGNSILI